MSFRKSHTILAVWLWTREWMKLCLAYFALGQLVNILFKIFIWNMYTRLNSFLGIKVSCFLAGFKYSRIPAKSRCRLNVTCKKRSLAVDYITDKLPTFYEYLTLVLSLHIVVCLKYDKSSTTCTWLLSLYLRALQMYHLHKGQFSLECNEA